MKEWKRRNPTIKVRRRKFFFPSAFVGVGSIHEKVAPIKDFYNNQKKDSTILMALIMLISALVLRSRLPDQEAHHQIGG
jgi:hypothetical protein